MYGGKHTAEEPDAMLLQNAAAYHLLISESANLSPRTLASYDQVHRLFIGYAAEALHKTPTLADLNRDLVRGFQLWLRKEHTVTRFGGTLAHTGPTTVRLYVKILKVWFNALDKDSPELFRNGNPLASLPLPRVEDRLPETLTTDQFLLLQGATIHTEQPKRNIAILRVLGDTGVRVSELCGIQVDGIQFVTPPPHDPREMAGRLRVMGKGSKEGEVAFGMGTKRALLDYIKVERRAYAGETELFLSEFGHPLGVAAIRRLLKRLATIAGMEDIRVNPHKFRHSTGTWMARDGISAFVIKEHLRHKNVSQTQKYVTLAAKDMAAAFRSPIDAKRGNGRNA